MKNNVWPRIKILSLSAAAGKGIIMRSILSAVTAFLIISSTAGCTGPQQPPPTAPAPTAQAQAQKTRADASASPAASSPAVKVDTLQTESFAMPYMKFGKPGGHLLIILPGLSVKSVLEFADSIAEEYKIFADRYEVYLLDRRTDIPPNYSISDMAKDTEAALGALELSQCDIFGVSQGGMIAQIIAADRPDLVRRLVLGSTTCRVTDHERKLFDQWIELAKNNDLAGLAKVLLADIYSDDYRRRNGGVYSAYIQTASPEDIRRFIIFTHSLYDFDISDKLGKIRCPVLVLGSRLDKLIDANASEELARKLCCQSYIYDGYSHAVFDEAPDYKQKVLEFFDESEHRP